MPGIIARHEAEAKATAAPSEVTPAAAATATATPAPPPPPAFSPYVIQPGDTISSIATAHGLDENYILWNNPEVSADPNLLLIGETLQLPSVNGIIYHVVLGDTLSDVAGYYHSDVQSIVGFTPNRLSSPDSVIEGMVLLLPGAVPPPPPPAPALVQEPPAAPAPPPVAAVEPAPVGQAPAPASSSGYIWPFHGAISQGFSATHHGIDIDGFGAYGAPIVAAASGTVILAAYQDWGYGNYVIIQHADGSSTLYAHLSAISVTQGQVVEQGEVIGALGSTGYSTGPHLHFEIHIGGVPVDPLAYLP